MRQADFWWKNRQDGAYLPHMQRTAWAMVFVLVACQSNTNTTPGMLGDACGASRGCADGLTCHDGTCAAIAGAADAGATDAATHPADAGHADGGGLTPDALIGGPDAGACGACNTPPDDCHARTGTCQNGACSYAFVEGATCDDGDACTVGDTCTNGGCFGTAMVCATPPAAVCLSGSEEKSYDQQGTCNGGLCVYQSHTVTCGAGGCTDGSCQTDACASITCDTPPSICYLATGSCADGSCSYGFNDGVACNDGNACTTNDQCNTGTCKGVPKTCAKPPASTCVDGTTLKDYAPLGTCAPADGTCSYTYSFVSCPTGCGAGACNPSGWTTMTSNTGNQLWSVWGSSASAVWAIGAQGTMVFYDGSHWEVRTSPSEALGKDLYAIHGTEADNVFMLAGSALLHYDGMTWTQVVDLATAQLGDENLSGIFATGDADNDVYVSAIVYTSGQVTPSLYVVDGTGTITPLVTGLDPDGQFAECYSPSNSVWEFSPTDVLFAGCYVREWNGTAVSALGSSANVAAERMWGANPSSVFGIAYTIDGGGDEVSIWDGVSWTTTPTGLNGYLNSVWGVSSSQVYFAGFDGTNNDGAIIYYDGLGFTNETLPAAAKQLELDGIWADPATGEVFAVGGNGLILKGP